ncbi:hypothetical protein J2X06_000590 [Lysobacter niastensis]|uniref:Uncharacterized protein n=1 Tax=Lysobacter niastensis TaxID=380629 RepID=A0ABU1W744_9GAMM|nr:hypothetical protein [Lysobacter niastensis]MDR7133406.1 hypothetical protein [Lysobacter niastensis]
MNQNYAQQHLSAEQWAQADAAINALTAALEPMLVALSLDERQRVVKMGDGSVAFCRTALDVIAENAALMPRSFDIEEMRRDLASHDALNARVVRLTKLLEKAHHTDMALGSDVMVAALEGYSYLKTAGKREGVEALRKLLGRRFEGNGSRSETSGNGNGNAGNVAPPAA